MLEKKITLQSYYLLSSSLFSLAFQIWFLAMLIFNQKGGRGRCLGILHSFTFSKILSVVFWIKSFLVSQHQRQLNTKESDTRGSLKGLGENWTSRWSQMEPYWLRYCYKPLSFHVISQKKWKSITNFLLCFFPLTLYCILWEKGTAKIRSCSLMEVVNNLAPSSPEMQLELRAFVSGTQHS